MGYCKTFHRGKSANIIVLYFIQPKHFNPLDFRFDLHFQYDTFTIFTIFNIFSIWLGIQFATTKLENSRSSRPAVFCNKYNDKISAKLTENYLC